MNENMKLKTSPKLRTARIIVFLIFVFLILCAIESIRGDFVEELSANHPVQIFCKEAMG